MVTSAFAKDIDDILSNKEQNQFLTVGEDLTYEVSWWFIKIGTIRTKVLDITKYNDEYRIKAAVYIDSCSGLPFVDLHAVFETEMDKNFYSNFFMSKTKDGKKCLVTRYLYDRINNRLFVEYGSTNDKNSREFNLEKTDTVKIQEKTQDGLSLLFFARANVRKGSEVKVPTMINSTKGHTILNFYNKHTDAEINAAEYPIDVIEFDGKALFKGIFGLTGPFKGWFSNDSAQIPIRAEMSVIIGSIDIELIKWSRND
ncbi:MAG: hypothetical protein STSR0008_17600 [Ignavibacterium sp.]